MVELNLSQFVEVGQAEQLYDLVGVIKHFGMLNNGHYRAVANN